jgi:hypothetical protein
MVYSLLNTYYLATSDRFALNDKLYNLLNRYFTLQDKSLRQRSLLLASWFIIRNNSFGFESISNHDKINKILDFPPLFSELSYQIYISIYHLI